MLTDEQQLIVNSVRDNHFIAVQALAGTGKTTTAKAIVDEIKPKKGLYTAFNKAIVEDTASKMQGAIQCKTLHSLAYALIKPKLRIETFNYKSIDEKLNFNTKVNISRLLQFFSLSKYLTLKDYCDNSSEVYTKEEISVTQKYLNQMHKGITPMTFDFILKELHIQLACKRLSIALDLFILDECQDSTGVALEIFQLVQATNKVMLGDTYQNIYSFMNTINGFKELSPDITLLLTNSFRCFPHIGETVTEFGKKHLANNFQFNGCLTNADDVVRDIAYLSYSNIGLIKCMYELYCKNKHFSTVRNINQIFELPILLKLLRNKYIPEYVSQEYKYLVSEFKSFKKTYGYTDFFEYLLEEAPSEDLESAFNLLKFFGQKGVDIIKFKDIIINQPVDKSIVLSTVHSFKGLERDKVILLPSVDKKLWQAIAGEIVHGKKRIILTEEEKIQIYNMYYVGLTRARKEIEIKRSV